MPDRPPGKARPYAPVPPSERRPAVPDVSGGAASAVSLSRAATTNRSAASASEAPASTGGLPSATPARPAVLCSYAELHCRTNFSFLEGASHPDELVARASELGYRGLAITDRNSVAGVVRAHVAAKSHQLPLIIGAELVLLDAPRVAVHVMNRRGYSQLCQLLTRGRRAAPKGECWLRLADLLEFHDGLLASVLMTPDELLANRVPDSTAGWQPTVEDVADAPPNVSAWRQTISQLKDAFGDRAAVCCELTRHALDGWWLGQCRQLSQQIGVRCLAAGDVLYHDRSRRPLQDVLSAIRHGCSVAELGWRQRRSGDHELKPFGTLSELYHDARDWLQATVDWASRCHFSLDELKYEYPEELAPAGLTPLAYLTQLTWQGARERYPDGIPEAVRRLIEHELVLIGELRYEAYFLTVWDLVRFARSRGILCQGRGSAANSAVCFCLGVTSVDPARIDVLFERFVSRERNEAPDIDVDFEHERREEVIQYIYEKYGRDRAGMTAEVITYRTKSAVRDVGKALGLSLDRVDSLASVVERSPDEEVLAKRFAMAGWDPTTRISRQYLALIEQILGFPRHLSQHVGGMVMTRGRLCELVPIENASMPGRTVIAWDKDDLDALGILKVDCLALGMLSAIRKTLGLIADHAGRELTLATIPAEDPGVYEMISRADTMGVFQIESRAQMSMLPRLQPREFYDLVIEVAIVRPGPIQGDMVHPYLRRRAGEEPVEFESPEIRHVLEKTLGVPIFQEQAMRLAVVAAGFTPGEADQLRRAMGAWRKTGVIDQFRRKLLDGMLGRGYSQDFAERLFKQIRGFGEYGFPESHAASFALLVYASAWLKRYYPAAFLAGLLNSQPMGFYAPAQLIAEARKHGVTVLPVEINASDWDCTLERVARTAAPGRSADQKAVTREAPGGSLAVRLGWRMLNGFAEADARRLVAIRGERPFTSQTEFGQRTGFGRAVISRLAYADAFRGLGIDRRQAVWQALPENEPVRLWEHTANPEPVATLPAVTPQDEVIADYQSTNLSLKAHPLIFLRPQLAAARVTPACELTELPHGRFLKVAGLVLLRQRPGSAKGITFVTLEDETGLVNLIIRPEIWERFYLAARRATILLAHGTLQIAHGVIHVLVTRLDDWSQRLAEVVPEGRDFR